MAEQVVLLLGGSHDGTALRLDDPQKSILLDAVSGNLVEEYQRTESRIQTPEGLAVCFVLRSRRLGVPAVTPRARARPFGHVRQSNHRASIQTSAYAVGNSPVVASVFRRGGAVFNGTVRSILRCSGLVMLGASVASIVTVGVDRARSTQGPVVAWASTSPAMFASCRQWGMLDSQVKLATAAELMVSLRHGNGELDPTQNTAPRADRIARFANEIDAQCAQAADPTRLAAAYGAIIYSQTPGLHPDAPGVVPTANQSA